MKIVEKINALSDKYNNNFVRRKNGTVLFCPGKIPKAKHMIFKGLTDEELNTYLISEYKNKFPTEYITFLKNYNGVDLFMFKVIVNKFEFASSYLTIYGLPRTKPFNRPVDNEEPFDIRIEDLNRHSKIPDKWLKCGSYKRTDEFEERTDLFIDTENGFVYSCNNKDYNILSKWNNLDECLCEIFENAINLKEEYIY